MWGSYTSYPTVTCYDEAKKLYERIKPMRGTEIRPIDRRSSNAKTNIRCVDDVYIIRLYNTDIIKYYADGSVCVSTGGWNTNATRLAISSMSPFAAWNAQQECAVGSRDRNLHVEHGCFVLPSGGLLFKPDGAGVLRPVDPPTAYKRKKRVRPEAKQWRKHFKQVPELIEAYSAAFAGGIAAPHYVPNVCELSQSPLTEEVASEMAMQYLITRWDFNTRGTVYVNNAPEAVRKFWADIYAYLALIEQYTVELPYGEVAS